MRVFQPALPSVAKQQFTFEGKVYKVSEPFPHRELGLHTTQLGGLWQAGLIDFVQPAVSAPVSAPAPESKPTAIAKPAQQNTVPARR